MVPTLEAMAAVYRLPATGGASSARFRRYVELGREGRPVSGYNPMTTQDVLGTIEGLLAVDAEARLEARARELAVSESLELSITVATPGMWTDRVATQVEHDLLGRGVGTVLWWCGDPVTTASVDAAARAQVVRRGWVTEHGPPAGVADAAGQEGLAAAVGRTVTDSAPDSDVAAALDVLGDDPALASMVAVLYGDGAARTLGFTPLGLAAGAGLRHCADAARRALATTPAVELIRTRWSPASPRG